MADYDFQNISDAVFHHAAATPGAPALICGRSTLSYAELAKLVGQATVWLGRRGVKAGDHADVAMSHSGEDIVAFVVGTPGFRHHEVDEHVRRRLPEAKRPKFIYYLDILPRTDNGKINRPALRAAPVNVTGRV